MKKIVKRWTSYLVANDIIKEQEKEIYSYGLYQGLLIVINILTTIAIGFLFAMVVESVLFMVAYIPLRSYGGGYHAKTQLRCYFVSIILIILSLSLLKFITIRWIIILGVSGVSGGIVYLLAPVEDKNKPLDQMEYTIYEKKSRSILLVEMLAILLLYLLGFKKISLVISISIFMVSLMLVMGAIKNNISVTRNT